MNEEIKKEKLYSGVDLLGNQEGSLDSFLLNSSKYSQENREMMMDAMCEWLNGKEENKSQSVIDFKEPEDED
jgi:hypothetical protein